MQAEAAEAAGAAGAGVPLIAALVGSLLGSFLNVCIVRLPLDQSVVRPRSRCPRCQSQIAWYDNIPVLSWLWLRARCRHCGQPISIQYPLIELAVAAIWGLAFWSYGLGLDAATAALFATILLGIAVTDARHMLIPDEYTWGGVPLGILLSLRDGSRGLLVSALGAAVGFLLLYGIARGGEKIFKEEAMGGGDIKMMAMVGAFVGWKGVLLTLFGGALLGTVIFVPLTLRRKRLVPFGVFLAAAAAFTFAFGDAVYRWYQTFLL